jgi:hypothetical protein
MIGAAGVDREGEREEQRGGGHRSSVQRARVGRLPLIQLFGRQRDPRRVERVGRHAADFPLRRKM